MRRRCPGGAALAAALLLLGACSLAQAAVERPESGLTRVKLAVAPERPGARRLSESCIVQYNEWVDAPCTGVTKCCPLLAALGVACLNSVLEQASSQSAALAQEITGIYVVCGDYYEQLEAAKSNRTALATRALDNTNGGGPAAGLAEAAAEAADGGAEERAAAEDGGDSAASKDEDGSASKALAEEEAKSERRKERQKERAREAAEDSSDGGREREERQRQRPASKGRGGRKGGKDRDGDSNGGDIGRGSSGCPDATLDAHNAARRRRGAPPLQWSDKLAAYAQRVSNTCQMEHSNGPFGENLAWGSALRTCAEAVAMWMEEESMWRPGGGFSSGTGHFTQVVWKSTRRVGCGLKCGLVTCSYDPPGNYGGQYDRNV